MATKKIREFRNLSKDELVSKIRENGSAYFDAKMKKVTGQLEDTASLWRMRKDLARMKMILADMARVQGQSIADQAPKQPGVK